MAELGHIIKTTTQLYNSIDVNHEMSAEQFYKYLVTYSSHNHMVPTYSVPQHFYASNSRMIRGAKECNKILTFAGSKGETGLKGLPGKDGQMGNYGVPG